jgi:hypothetical protein
MAVTKQTTIEACRPITFIEHHIKAGAQFTGEAPKLLAVDFVPYADDYDQVIRYASPTDYAVIEGDKGGLFFWETAAPTSVEYIFADLGTVTPWNIYLVTPDNRSVLVETGNSQYIVRTAYQRFHLARSCKIKLVTTVATLAMWARVGFTLNEGMR